jgi:hypothetical protein
MTWLNNIFGKKLNKNSIGLKGFFRSLVFFWCFHFAVLALLIIITLHTLQYKAQIFENSNIENTIMGITTQVESYSNKNNYYNLQSTKQKIIKERGYKNIGEIVVNTQELEESITSKSVESSKNPVSNWEQWQKCLFGKDIGVVNSQQSLNSSNYFCR